MAKVTLLNGQVVGLKESDVAAVVGSRKHFANERELKEFLEANADLATGYGRKSRFEVMALMQQRQADRSFVSA